MSLYYLLLIFSISVPFALSFDRRLQFFRTWKYLFPSIIVVAALYILFDIYFTKMGFWGFNPTYLSGAYILGLPIEEILFFVIIPYASIFLHESILEYFPQVRLRKSVNEILSGFLIVLSIVLVLTNLSNSYTFYIFSKLVLALFLALVLRSESLPSFYLTFFVILVPFLIVNGILTGSFITEEVVWYNDNENLGIRIFTIPIEDFAYAFSMILLNLLLVEKLKKIY